MYSIRYKASNNELGVIMTTCNFEATLVSGDEVETAYCGYPYNHSGEHGNWEM